MELEPRCPLCRSDTWKVLGRKTFLRTDEPSSQTIKRRLDVLWNVWYPASDVVTITSIACMNCGFVTYSPRPTTADIENKYVYLTSQGPDPDIGPVSDHYTKSRIDFLMKQLRPYLGAREKKRILDFGGGDGRLMSSLIAEGHECFVIDFSKSTLPGVVKLADQLSEVEAGEQPFDLIVASHVLEHVAEPAEIVKGLHDLSSRNGLIYVEVPMEIWGRPPLQKEPVTHINFFTRESLTFLLRISGFEILRCSVVGKKLFGGYRSCVIRAIGRRAEAEVNLEGVGVNPVEKLLKPSLIQKLWWESKHPGRFPTTIINKAHQLWTRSMLNNPSVKTNE